MFFNTNTLPRINIGVDVWVKLSIMTGVYSRWFSSTLHIRWGLCDCLCLLLVCRGRYDLGGVFLLFILGPNLEVGGPVRGLWGGDVDVFYLFLQNQKIALVHIPFGYSAPG